MSEAEVHRDTEIDTQPNTQHVEADKKHVLTRVLDLAEIHTHAHELMHGLILKSMHARYARYAPLEEIALLQHPFIAAMRHVSGRRLFQHNRIG